MVLWTFLSNCSVVKSLSTGALQRKIVDSSPRNIKSSWNLVCEMDLRLAAERLPLTPSIWTTPSSSLLLKGWAEWTFWSTCFLLAVQHCSQFRWSWKYDGDASSWYCKFCRDVSCRLETEEQAEKVAQSSVLSARYESEGPRIWCTMNVKPMPQPPLQCCARPLPAFRDCWQSSLTNLLQIFDGFLSC